MNWKTFLLGIGAGIVGGYVTSELISKKTFISPEKVLENAKKSFKEHGSINGSWINMTVEPYEKGVLAYKVYKGGITREIEGINEQYEFISDALTGTIIDVQKL
ncbi:PepSY domain-containing protein [Cytobacillus sp. Hz8]|uniref:PepSY domain-containing protein n=1 Tax=Cytobacillus sp. Hz8 TaxID=3347168 RepID=UPI0035E33F05